MSPRTRAVVLVIVVVAIVAGFIWYASSGNHGTAPSSTVPPGTPVFAPKGEIVTGFPKALILDSNPSVDGSYSINYSANLNQYTAEWNSSSSMETLYDAYKTYLPAHGWTITNDITKYADSRGLYATNATSEVSVAVIEQGGSAQINVTYISK